MVPPPTTRSSALPVSGYSALLVRLARPESTGRTVRMDSQDDPERQDLMDWTFHWSQSPPSPVSSALLGRLEIEDHRENLEGLERPGSRDIPACLDDPENRDELEIPGHRDPQANLENRE